MVNDSLRSLLAKYDAVISYAASHLPGLHTEAGYLARPSKRVRRQFDRGARAVLETNGRIQCSRYSLVYHELDTLSEGKAACTSVLDAFFSLLNDETYSTVSTAFAYFLAKETTEPMMHWVKIETLANFRDIIIPINNRSALHRGLDVVLPCESKINIYDPLPSRNSFLPILLRHMKWANSVGKAHNLQQWSRHFSISHQKDCGDLLEYCVDSSIYMCGHA